MAKGTAKVNDAKNRQQIQLFRRISVLINAGVIAYHFCVAGDLISVKTLLCVAFFAAQEYYTILALENHGKPVFGDEGHIVSCPNLKDTKDLGMYTYVQDLLWVCWATQVILLFSSFGWIIYMAVPSYGLYKTWDTVKPMFKRAMEYQRTGGNMAAQVPPGHRLAGPYAHSRKEKRAAARQAEKDERNAAKAQQKATTVPSRRKAARPTE
eukprot:TRINITY_DN9227_c0_g3_i1.p1 TRINITY_DN9227_c0_g3~~TRINITY_DN9227_c0_g3_i1.p1  ORF type:complete len:228 (+),score=83.99 TRINITY_DN9227_c0_g3_i1:56-685(+)